MRRRGKGEGTGGRRRETPAIPPGQRRSAAAPQGINKQGHSEDNPGQRQGHSRDKCEDKTRTPGHGRATPAQQARRSSDKTRHARATGATADRPRTGPRRARTAARCEGPAAQRCAVDAIGSSRRPAPPRQARRRARRDHAAPAARPGRCPAL